jgi:hypothetical protein
MGNKTIYVSDEKLWKEAKKLAGAKRLSAVIADALRKYVAEKRLEEEGFQDWRFAAGPGGADRISFNGKVLVSRTYGLEQDGGVWPPEIFEVDDIPSASIEIYLTRKGTFVVCGDLVGQGKDEGVPVYWKAHQGTSSLRTDPALMTLHPTDRANLLDEVSLSGDDWATRID